LNGSREKVVGFLVVNEFHQPPAFDEKVAGLFGFGRDGDLIRGLRLASGLDEDE
jgi:hypothetical protein